MDRAQFWAMVEAARSVRGDCAQHAARLVAALAELPAAEILAYEHIHDELMAESYQTSRSTRSPLPISCAPDLDVAAGQPNHWSLNPRMKTFTNLSARGTSSPPGTGLPSALENHSVDRSPRIGQAQVLPITNARNHSG